MDVIKIKDLFSEEEINKINKHFNDNPEDNDEFSISKELGRYQFCPYNFDPSLTKKLLKIANSLCNFPCTFTGATVAEYNIEYGNPSLPPHFDGDKNDLIINYQLSSNTKWAVGIDLNLYDIEDNSALIFHPNENIHWRPKKKFNNGEFVRMIFFRFQNSENVSDFSHLRYSQDHPVFYDVLKFRDSVSEVLHSE